MNDINIDFENNVVEVKNQEYTDDFLWRMWEMHPKSIIYVRNKDTLTFSTSLNSGIHIYFRNGYVTDSLQRIKEREISEKNVRRFLAYGYFPNSLTLYKNVFCVESGHCLRINLNSGRFESIPLNLDKIVLDDISLNDAIDKTFGQMIRNFAGDRVWFALSGGLDSTYIYSYFTGKGFGKERAEIFNLFVEGGRDESAYLHSFLRGDRGICRIEMHEDDAWKAFICHAHKDEIFGFPIILKYEYMMEKLHDLGCRKLVMGDGPDELFVCRDTYEKYVDHDYYSFLPLRPEIVDETIFGGHFSTSPETNIWALYNLEFQGATNVRFLYDIAREKDIDLIEPFLNGPVMSWCIKHAKEMVGYSEKEPLKRLAKNLVPDEIINRRKMGYCSDFGVWTHKNGKFYEYIQHSVVEGTLPNVLEPYREHFLKAYEEDRKMQYDANKRTGGVGGQSFLFCYLLLAEFLKRH